MKRAIRKGNVLVEQLTKREWRTVFKSGVQYFTVFKGTKREAMWFATRLTDGLAGFLEEHSK